MLDATQSIHHSGNSTAIVAMTVFLLTLHIRMICAIACSAVCFGKKLHDTNCIIHFCNKKSLSRSIDTYLLRKTLIKCNGNAERLCKNAFAILMES